MAIDKDQVQVIQVIGDLIIKWAAAIVIFYIMIQLMFAAFAAKDLEVKALYLSSTGVFAYCAYKVYGHYFKSPEKPKNPPKTRQRNNPPTP